MVSATSTVTRCSSMPFLPQYWSPAERLKVEYPFGVTTSDLVAHPRGQSIHSSEATWHIADIVRVVRAVEHVVFAHGVNRHSERFLRIDHRIEKQPIHIGRRRRADSFTGRIDPLVAAIETADEVRQCPAAMRTDDLEFGISVEETIKDHAGQSERRVEHKSDRHDEHIADHIHTAHRWWRRRM